MLQSWKLLWYQVGCSVPCLKYSGFTASQCTIFEFRIHDLKSQKVSKHFVLRSNKSQAPFDRERESDKTTRHL